MYLNDTTLTEGRVSTGSATPTTAITPRDYQIEGVEAAIAASKRDIQRMLIALPTGSGKTILFALLILRLGGRAIVLVHRDELVWQAVAKIKLVIPGADVGVVKAERDGHDHQIVVASVQTLSRPSRLARLARTFRLVIIDEAHHSTAESYERIVRALGGYSAGGPLVIGVTATPERADGTPLGDVFEEIVYQRTMLEMISAGHLVDPRGVQVKLNVDYRTLHVRAGDYVASEVEEMLSAADAPQHAVDAYRQHANGRTAIVFTPTVASAYAFAEAFRDAGISAEALDGATPLDERHAILDRLSTGVTLVIVNCAVLTEGFDCPRVSAIIIARPTKSRPLYVQMVGRGSRLYPGKDDMIVIDLVGVTSRHDLMTLASLFNVTPKALATMTVSQAVDAEREAEEQTQPAPITGHLVSVPVELFKRRQFHWVPSGRRFILSTGAGSMILEPQEDGSAWRIIEQTRARGARIIARDMPLEWAQGRAEDAVRARGNGAITLVTPDAPWRMKPATPKQIELLARHGFIAPLSITAGEASDLISAKFADKVAV